jgi:tungstate transport system permease protein
MKTLLDGIGDGLSLIFSGDDQVWSITFRTLRIALEATLIATLLGVPLGCLLGLGRFRGRRGVLGLVNAGIRMPPVALGQILWLLMWPASLWGGGPLSGLHWIYTDSAVVLAQTLLALPIVAALTSAALQAVPSPLLAQASAFGASWPQRAALAFREARVGIYAALIAALGTAIASVGAVVVIGPALGSSTLASAALVAWNVGGTNARAVAYGTVLLGLFLLLAALLTLAQQTRTSWLPSRTS